MEKYIQLAKELGMVNAMIISPKEICFDIRAILKCRWGCEDFFQESYKMPHQKYDLSGTSGDDQEI